MSLDEINLPQYKYYTTLHNPEFPKLNQRKLKKATATYLVWKRVIVVGETTTE